MRIRRLALLATVSLASLNLAHGNVNESRSTAPQGRALVTASRVREAAPPSNLLERIRQLMQPGVWMSTGSTRRVLAEARCFGAPEVSLASCNGLGSLEENLAAVRAAETLRIPFDQLKELMSRGYSLDAAVRKLRPGMDYSSELRRAREQARKDLSRLSS
jgi:uncharacterized protein YoaH (UPF0181 family)